MFFKTMPEPQESAIESLNRWFDVPHPAPAWQPYQNIDWRRYCPSEIQKTAYYDKHFFDGHAPNRCPLSEHYIRKMIALISAVGFLPEYPIVLDANGLLLDGLHRYAAAARLMSSEIYYVTIDYAAAELFPQPAPKFNFQNLTLN